MEPQPLPPIAHLNIWLFRSARGVSVVGIPALGCVKLVGTTRMRTLAVLILLLAISAGFYWKLAISGEYTWLESPDMAFQVRPWLDFGAREFHTGRLPLWDPYLYAGQSLIGQVQTGAATTVSVSTQGIWSKR